MRRATLLAVLLLAGCSHGLLPGDDATCPVPGGAACAPVGEVFDAARSGRSLEEPILKPGQDDEAAEADDGESTAVASPATPPGSPGVVSVGTIYADAEGFPPPGAMPLRERPPIMRIWMAPFTTSDGDLVMAGYVFTEVEPRRWSVGAQPPRGGAVGLYTVPPETVQPPMAPAVPAPPEAGPMAPPPREFQDVRVGRSFAR